MMKRLSSLLLLLLCAVLLMTGCSSDKAEDSSAAAQSDASQPVATAQPTATPAPALPTATAIPAASDTPESDYNAAMAKLQRYDYAGAAADFAALGNYSDASLLAMYASALAAGENGSYDTAIANLQTLGDFRDAELQAQYYIARRYEAAGNYERAAQLLNNMSLFRDSAARVASYDALIANRAQIEAENRQAASYAEAVAAQEAGNLTRAIARFTWLGDYRDSAARAAALQEQLSASRYAEASLAEQNGQLGVALQAFTELGDYADSAARAAALQQSGGYAIALEHANAGRFEQAYEAFAALGSYQDSADKAFVLRVATFAETTDCGNGVGVYSFHNAYGLFNVNTNTLIAPTWDQVGRFDEAGMAIVRSEGKYGCISNQGVVVIPCQFDLMSSFADGKCTVGATNEEGVTLYGIYDTQGAAVTPVQWLSLGDSRNGRIYEPAFTDGRIRVQGQNEKWGYLDAQCQPIGTVSWKSVDVFENGRCKVQNDEDKYTFIDEQGAQIGTAFWSSIGEPVDGRYPVTNDDGLCALINEQGEQIGTAFFRTIGSFNDGLAAVTDSDNKIGFIDVNGAVVVEPQYTEVSAYCDGLAAVRNGRYWNYINTTGEVVISARYTQAGRFSNGQANVCLENVGWQIINTTGELLYFVTPEMATSYDAAVALCEAGQQAEAYEAFMNLAGYRDSAAKAAECRDAVYASAVNHYNAGEFAEAAQQFSSLMGYRDSATLYDLSAAELDGYTVASEGPYGFVLNSSGFYESQNKGHHYTTAACTVTLRSSSRVAYIDVINYAETGYDYGSIYRLDSRSNRWISFSDSSRNRSSVQTFTINLPDTEEHTLYITFYKDSSGNRNNDSMQFRVRFPDPNAPAPQSSFSVESSGRYGFSMNSNGYYESQNKGQHGTTAACTVTVQSNTGHVYLDVINYGESSFDYGILYALDDNNTRFASPNNSSSVQTFEYLLPDANEHTIYITYRKDGSVNSGNDSLQFRVRFE